MSGGSMNYIFGRIEEEVVGKLYDKELNELAKDFVKLCYECEWWTSGDTSEEQYREEASKFKKKWLRGNSKERLEEFVSDIFNEAKKEALEMIKE